MNDPRTEAMHVLGDLLKQAERKALTAEACMQMIEHVRLVPGLLKRVAHALSAQRSAPAVDALLCLAPNVPGVVEGLYQAFLHGVSRKRTDGEDCAPMLALDFRRSRARAFEDLLQRARAAFGDRFETLDVGGKIHYRFGLQSGRGTLAGRASAVSHDLQWLHQALGKLKGTRLWLNGWPFPSEGPLTAAHQVHLVRAWLAWAGTQTHTRTG